jgi:hypothetical protein
MPTKRLPIGRSPTPQITKRAIALFEQMRKLERACACPPIDWNGEYWKRQQCASCEQWWALHSELCDELGCQPWHWPAIENPLTQNPYPPGCAAYLSWQPNPGAQARWKALARAALEAGRARRAAAKAKRAAATPPPSPPPPLPASGGPPGQPQSGA